MLVFHCTKLQLTHGYCFKHTVGQLLMAMLSFRAMSHDFGQSGKMFIPWAPLIKMQSASAALRFLDVENLSPRSARRDAALNPKVCVSANSFSKEIHFDK